MVQEMRHIKGFTLAETLVALAVLAGAAMLTAPGFGQYLRDCRRAATLNALVHAVHSARTVAATHGLRATLCATLNGQSCSRSQDWSDSLLVLPEQLTGSSATPTPVRVVRLEATRVRQSVRSNRGAIDFEPLSPHATTATVTVCDDRGAHFARAVIVSRTGRPRISERDASGRLLACP